ncbi:sugar phosphate nucleotidyltransferase [Flavobacteriales bacterium]|nr:sugar phosphate nucleotidyltransferase [Flavobacteriales bacterium]
MRSLNPTIIMAAGKGSRMKAASAVPAHILLEAQSRPKAMIRIGRHALPLLEHLLLQLRVEGSQEACVVIAEGDTITEVYFEENPVPEMAVSFVRQSTPKTRNKPLGTAHAVQLALEANPHWTGQSIAIANGDNLPPRGMFQALFAHHAALPAFDPRHLGLPSERVLAFAVLQANERGDLTGITEKPTLEQVENARWKDGQPRVSMNYFRLPYQQLLSAVCAVSEHPVRKERELPEAISLFIQSGGEMTALSMAGAFLDLTHPSDIENAAKTLDAGGHDLHNRT